MQISFGDFTKYQRRLLTQLAGRSGWQLDRLNQDRESDLRVLAAFGLVDTSRRCLTVRGHRLYVEGVLS